MRKLATLETILEIKPHNNADALEIAIVRGWQVVVAKGVFKAGDLCVFFEIDSLLPCKEPFEFLRKSCYRQMANGVEGFRLKTIKLRSERSQGLIIPFNELFEGNRVKYNDNVLTTLEPGIDVTDLLEVVRWEPPMSAHLQGIARGSFPSLIPRTDSERVQNLWPFIKNQNPDTLFEVSLKLDGTSATYFWYEGRLGTCSRNLELHMDGYFDKGDTVTRCKDTYVSVATRQGVYQALEKLGRSIAIQSEILGEGIQGNKEKLIGQQLFIFDVFDIDKHRYLTPVERVELLTEMNLIASHIPVLEHTTLDKFKTLDDMLSYADGKSLNAEIREGVVFKAHTEDRVNFKAISDQFLFLEK